MIEYEAEIDAHESGYCYTDAKLQSILISRGYQAVVREKAVQTDKPVDRETISFLFNSAWISLVPKTQ